MLGIPATGCRKILFQHIPKTAGTALIQHAREYLGSKVCAARYDAELTDALIRDDSLVFYHGHYSFRTVCRFRALQPDTFVFAFVRHPFGRTLSQYYNWIDADRVRRELDQIARIQGEDAGLRRLRAKFEGWILAMSLNDFLSSEDPDIAHVARNLQAQYLTDPGLPEHRRLANAVPNALLSYDFMGLQEFYLPCLRIVEACCSLPAGCLGQGQRANTSDRSEADGTYRITRRQLEELERHNAYDLALFYSVYTQLYRSYGDLMPPIDIGAGDLSGVSVI